MPSRTNDFQRLVKIINHNLASEDAKITESAMLYDEESKTKREVDILVESKLLNTNLKIGIECKDEARPMDITALESYKEKHRKLGINQTIIVTKKGFTKSAKEYAIKNHIKLLTFNSAKSENWSKNYSHLKQLALYARSYFLKSISITYSIENSDPHFQLDIDTQAICGDISIPAHLFVTEFFRRSDIDDMVFGELIENEKKGGDPFLNFGINIDKRLIFKDRNGHTATPDSLDVVMGYKSNYKNLDLRQVNYDDASMVVGGFSENKGKTFANLVANESNGKMKVSLELSGDLFPIIPEHTEPPPQS